MAAVPLVAACAPAASETEAAAAPGSGRVAEATPTPAATPATTPATTSATRTAARPKQPKVPPGTTAGYVVFDRKTGKITSHRNSHRPFRSASVVKILMAIDFLESRKSVTPQDQALLKVMLRASDDNAATTLWQRGGQKQIIQRMARKLQLADTTPPPEYKPGFWGYTAISASDITRTYRYLLDRADPKVSGLILGHLRKAAKCGTDGFDQSFGIPDAVPRPWAVKQGWSGFGTTPPVPCARASTTSVTASTTSVTASTTSVTERAARPAASVPEQAALPVVPDLGRPVLHTTGLVGTGDRLIIVLLTAHPAGASWQESVKRTTTLAKGLYLYSRPN
ncbi:D-alanyl-D-alanine carboxypeptidase family protein [Streptosporangium soli]|nr:hypothetical protein [Streptosporangium sp. KLBMP 9127]